MAGGLHLVQAHLATIDKLEHSRGARVLNCGTEIFRAQADAIEVNVELRAGPRQSLPPSRPGGRQSMDPQPLDEVLHGLSGRFLSIMRRCGFYQPGDQ